MSWHKKDWLTALLGGGALATGGLGLAGIGPLAGLLGAGEAAGAVGAGAGALTAGDALAGGAGVAGMGGGTAALFGPSAAGAGLLGDVGATGAAAAPAAMGGSSMFGAAPGLASSMIGASDGAALAGLGSPLTAQTPSMLSQAQGLMGTKKMGLGIKALNTALQMSQPQPQQQVAPMQPRPMGQAMPTAPVQGNPFNGLSPELSAKIQAMSPQQLQMLQQYMQSQGGING